MRVGMFKTGHTIQAYEQYPARPDVVITLEDIASQMSGEAKNILNEAETPYVAGEMIIYELLTKDGVDEKTAARAAVLFPDIIRFNPAMRFEGVFILKDRYRELVAAGTKPLYALLALADEILEFNKNLYDYPEKHLKFNNFIRDLAK